jgi:hypothetical protein
MSDTKHTPSQVQLRIEIPSELGALLKAMGAPEILRLSSPEDRATLVRLAGLSLRALAPQAAAQPVNTYNMRCTGGDGNHQPDPVWEDE